MEHRWATLVETPWTNKLPPHIPMFAGIAVTQVEQAEEPVS